MASPGNRHCASCIGTLSSPLATPLWKLTCHMGSHSVACRAKLITHFDDRPVVTNFLRPRFGPKFQMEIPLCLEVPVFPYNTVLSAG